MLSVSTSLYDPNSGLVTGFADDSITTEIFTIYAQPTRVSIVSFEPNN